MGSFYTNITLRGVLPRDVTEALVREGRTAFVAPAHPGGTTVFDLACEGQDPAVLGHLARLLSRRFSCPALAVINHDDDILALALYRGGSLETEYETAHTAGLRVLSLCAAWERPLVTPLVWLLLRAPTPLFEVARHGGLARLLGLPSWSVGTGYRYLAQGELPPGLTVADLIHVPVQS
jgi:hypothetical protein